MDAARHHLARRLRGAAMGWIAISLLVLVAAGCLVTTLAPGDRLTRSKCGACHLRPRPGQLPRARLSGVLDAHGKRFPLTPAEKLAILDHLAPAAAGPAVTGPAVTGPAPR